MVKFQLLLSAAVAALFAGEAAVAQKALPNWVGPKVGKPIDSACYRKSYITNNKQCATGYAFDKVATCWAQCPIEYPVECAMECLPQGGDCALAILSKITSVGTVALSAAGMGVSGQLSSASKGVQTGLKCGQKLFEATSKIISYIKEIETGGKQIATTKDQLMFLLNKADFVVYDLPVAVTTCMGLTMPSGLQLAKPVAVVVKTIIEKIITSKSTGENILSADAFLKFLNDVGLGKSVAALSAADKATLKSVVAAGGSTCGSSVSSVVDKIVITIGEFKKQNPSSTIDAIKFMILNSNVVLKELPAAVSSCFTAASADAYKNRDSILKTVHSIIDKIVEATSKNGSPVSAETYALTITDMGLDVISRFDPTGLANMAKQFIQPICGPTAYIGQVDDGPADQALGLSVMDKAFASSAGTWAKKGDGQLRVTFKSADDKDVRVNIYSAGIKLYEIPVKKGQTVVWTKPLAEFQGKTLYMDRWRPGFLSIPSTSGGSFLTWVSGTDGALTLSVKINPTASGLFGRALRH